jgi:ATP-dependent DNA helicase HFM1/MER3
MKPNERVALREFNKSSFIKYPIKENISTTPQKIFLMVQVQLGGVDLPSNKDFLAIRRQFLVEKKVIFERIQRLIRCVIDCKSVDCDAISTRHALDLARSLAAEFWEYSNLQLRQIPQIGPAITRKLVANKVNSVESLANLDTASIERIMGRNPPFGRKILDLLRDFPSLTLASEIVGRAASRPGENPKVNIKVQLSFTNARTPLWNGRKPSLTFMAETSNGALVHLWRGNIQRLDKVQELQFVAEICSPDDEIKCHIACDDIVGTSRSSSLRPNIPASAFPVTKSIKHAKASSKRKARDEFDEFGCDDFEDNELLAAVKGADAPAHEYGSDGFADVDDSDEAVESSGLKRVKSDEVLEPVQMENGKWACNHPCRGGQALKTGQPCKHKCCHEGLDRPRKPRRKVNVSHLSRKIQLG